MEKITLKQRQEIPSEMQWDLESLYKTSEAWEKDFALVQTSLDKFLSFQGSLSQSAKNICDAFKANDELERLAEKIYTYAHLRSDEDTANSTNRARVDRTVALFADIAGKTAWFEPEILAIDDATMEEFLNSSELAFYKRSLQELLRSKPHTLSEKEERILGMSSDVMGTPRKTFNMLNNADLEFPYLTTSSGENIQLTHGNYTKFLESEDRALRRQAFDKMYDTYQKFRNTFASTLDGTVKHHALNAKLRSYDSALDAALFHDNVDRKIYTNLIKTVHNRLPSLHKYMQLRKKALKLEQLEMSDIFCPLVPDYKMEVAWEQAVTWVKQALKPLGEEYCAKLENAFSQRWVDVLENKGKRSGAYSSGCYDSYPYLLLNYNNTLNDVFTLAHELGHSMHTLYSKEKQEYHYADYRIFVAEVASTTNEQLLHHYLMKNSSDKELKTYLLCHLLNEIRGTIYRQTQFAEFELWMHEQSENGIPLTADLLTQKYFELNKTYYGDAVTMDEKIGVEWARIPHFYYNFYVYKYATGLSAAIELSQNVLSGDKQLLGKYLGFLQAGSSKDVLYIMSDAGVDLSSPQPIEQALDLFDKTVDELESLLL